MHMKTLFDRRILALVCVNAALYVFILIIVIGEATGQTSAEVSFIGDLLKYAGIISCLFICIFALSHPRREVAGIQAIVFAFTLGADFFLLFTPFFAVGAAVFCGAHICALLRYRPRVLLPACICAAAVFIIAATVLHLPMATAVPCAYTVLIISVTISTFFADQPRLNAIFSRLGMLLFIACDINVAFFNALPSENILHTAAIFLMWGFYLPAQTLLALSATSFVCYNEKQQ